MKEVSELAKEALQYQGDHNTSLWEAVKVTVKARRLGPKWLTKARAVMKYIRDRDEQELAEEWYREHRENENRQQEAMKPWKQRRDELLPIDQLI